MVVSLNNSASHSSGASNANSHPSHAGPPVLTLDSVVTLTASVTNHGPADGKFVAALYAQSLTSVGQPSPVRALPRMQLIAFNKVDTSVGVPVTVKFSVDVSSVPGIERQPLPGLLRLWVGDGGTCESNQTNCAVVTVPISGVL
jgi:hypothetical protein